VASKTSTVGFPTAEIGFGDNKEYKPINVYDGLSNNSLQDPVNTAVLTPYTTSPVITPKMNVMPQIAASKIYKKIGVNGAKKV
jgi:hypothetical protein